jgi:hypothetical protein
MRNDAQDEGARINGRFFNSQTPSILPDTENIQLFYRWLPHDSKDTTNTMKSDILSRGPISNDLPVLRNVDVIIR